MCGIVGIADFSKMGIGYTELEAFQQLLISDSARGMDGTGIIKINEKGTCEWRKMSGHPFTLLDDTDVQKKFLMPILKDEYCRILIGHNRYRSSGPISTKTSHPFQKDHIIMVHNGTVPPYSDIPEMKEIGKDKKFVTDTEALCHAISARGIQQVVKESIGPFALVYYDAKDNTVNMVRNTGRPLYWGKSDYGTRMVFGSEVKLLEWVADRKSLLGLKFEQLEEYTLYTWSLDSETPIKTKLSQPTWSSSGGGVNGNVGWDRVLGKEPPELKAGEYLVFEEGEWVKHLTGELETGKSDRLSKGAYRQAGVVRSVGGGRIGFITEYPKRQNAAHSKDQSHLSRAVDALYPFPMTTNPAAAETKLSVNRLRWQPVSMLSGFAKGAEIMFDMHDYKEVDKEKEIWAVNGGVDFLPETEIKFNVKGSGKVIDALMDAKKIKGVIQNILKDTVATVGGKSRFVIYVSHPEPIYNVPAYLQSGKTQRELLEEKGISTDPVDIDADDKIATAEVLAAAGIEISVNHPDE